MISPATIVKIQEHMRLAGVDENDLQESFVMGSGAGGQKVNKTSSAVRLSHKPSNLTVKVSTTRSRETNRWLARRELAEKILERQRSEHSRRIQAAEKIRRQKRRRSRRAKARMLDDKRRHGEKKALRAPIHPSDT